MSFEPDSTTEPNIPQISPADFSFEPVHPEERRQWMRFRREPDTDYATIVSPAELAGRVEILDESLGGFGFVATQARSFHIDQKLEIFYAGTRHVAQVRHITPMSNGRFRVGVRCR